MVSALLPTYARADLAFERGDGAWLTSTSTANNVDATAAEPYVVTRDSRLADSRWLGGTSVVCIAVDPASSVLYAGTTVGVRTSPDGGATWTRLDNGLTNRNVQALAVAGSTVLAGIGSGVFESVDGGATWTATARGIPAVSVSAVAIGAPGTFYAATVQGLFATGDGGAIGIAIVSLIASARNSYVAP